MTGRRLSSAEQARHVEVCPNESWPIVIAVTYGLDAAQRHELPGCVCVAEFYVMIVLYARVSTERLREPVSRVLGKTSRNGFGCRRA